MKPPFYVITFILTLTASSASAQVTFTDISQEAGVIDEHLYSLAVAWGNYDVDGDLDLYVSHGSWGTYITEADVLYRNNSNGTFTDVLVQADLGKNTGDAVCSAFIDYDNDGDGTFTDVAKEAGIKMQQRGGGCAFADYDSDGDLDLYAANYGGPDALYRNNGSNNKRSGMQIRSEQIQDRGLYC